MDVIDRRRFVGDVTVDLPFCVLEDLAKSLGIKGDFTKLRELTYRTKLVKVINNIPLRTISKSKFEIREYRHIAQFLNYDDTVEWEMPIMMKIFKKINRPTSKHYIPPARELCDIEISNPTPESPEAVNVCIWYMWCIMLGGTPHSHMTSETIKKYVVNLQSDENELIKLANTAICRMGKTSLALMLTEYDDRKHNRTVSMELTRENFFNIHAALSTHNVPLDKMTPYSPIEAVYLAAMQENLDISTSSLLDLDYKTSNKKNSSRFAQYLDTRMLEIIKLNPTAYSIDDNFNSMFPIEMYNTEQLQNILQKSNMPKSISSGLNMYQELAVNDIVDSFYAHIHPALYKFTTPVELQDIRSSDDAMLCYGSRTTEITPMLVDELNDTFSHHKSFINPCGGTFSKESIDTLKVISSKTTNVKYHDSWRRLMLTIAQVEIYQGQQDLKVRDLLITYDILNAEDKQSTYMALKSLEELAMFMRGWIGADEYPIEDAYNIDQTGTFIRVCDALRKFRESSSETYKFDVNILNLPLLRFRDGQYVKTSDPQQGITIGDRLTIVETGDRLPNVNSCIRTTSNYLAASAYRYMEILGLTPGFEIGKLRYIL